MRLRAATRTAVLIAGAAALISSLTVGMSLTASTTPSSPPVGETVSLATPQTNMVLLNDLSSSMPTMPAGSGSLQTWTTWSRGEDKWARTASIPLSAALASQGERLVEFSLIPNIPVYGAPAGVTETGFWGVTAPANRIGSTALIRQGSTR